MPPVLYVPVRRSESGTVETVRLPMDNGGMALVAFTALDRLARGCGEGQEWALVFTSTLDKVRAESPFDAVAFDVEFPGGLERVWQR